MANDFTKDSAPRWVTCDLDCEGCREFESCPFIEAKKRRKKRGSSEQNLKKEKKKKQKENRKKSQSVSLTETCAKEAGESSPGSSSEGIDDESLPDEIFGTQSKVVSQDVDWFISFWNRTMDENHARLPRLNYMKKTQITRLKCRQYHWGKERLRTIIIKASKSDYLNCRTGKRVNMQIDWYLVPNHLEDVYMGKYDNYTVEARPLTPEEQHQLELERYKAREAERRAEARRIDEEESARRAAAREYAAQHCVSYEEYQRMKQNGELS